MSTEPSLFPPGVLPEPSPSFEVGPIFGLTLHQPWASAIVAGPKRLENRGWAPSHRTPFWLALHAGKTMARIEPCDLPDWPDFPPFRTLPRGAILGVARVHRVATGEDHLHDPWSSGERCRWLLDEVRALPVPIPRRGEQGLWELSKEEIATLAPIWRPVVPVALVEVPSSGVQRAFGHINRGPGKSGFEEFDDKVYPPPEIDVRPLRRDELGLTLGNAARGLGITAEQMSGLEMGRYWPADGFDALIARLRAIPRSAS